MTTQSETSELLHHVTMPFAGPRPERFALVCHGVFGMGSNLRSLAQRLGAADPSWGFVLCDLRGHGGSAHLAPPHSLDRAADDLAAVARALDAPVRAVIAHSFGGKVATIYGARHPDTLDHLFVLDSLPSARPESLLVDMAGKVLALLESMPDPLASRAAFDARLADAGYEKAIIEWLAMNVKLEGGVYRLRLDLPAIRAMLTEYFARDTWDLVASPHTARHVHLIIGGASHAFPAEDAARVRELARTHPHLTVEVLEGAGHWLHVERPKELAEAIARDLGNSPAAG